MNWTIVLLRGARLPAMGIAVALVIMWAAWNMRGTPHGAAFFEPFRWASLALLTFALVAYGYFMHRLLRWERTQGDQGCVRCGGPTGVLQTGRLIRGNQLSDFRRCYSCGKTSPDA
ncbi:hypothetical protein [Luteimonas fraxinea]|uniref:hypothetical protein n=1 Tax=Luteimonas fraxinea TaxID=2901869 RepID=UPI001E53E9AC|nr:hypothetical protein [Luteimonas fraxinea]MCD9126689.1 hypothetical protein [Luteimonas fraxinea]